ncbi:hypothetical protein ROZALSC1DRAFT_15299 [Rozella allomycis CSF55]|uniref:Galactose oxidase n=1 Tax=Rozella allomycis (strain CSF55) TaxID=988480 RepID=A0A4P9YFP3_ROZAC|nr:hypothetical protein ROZALSC1DRAFT_15299 [Rozella allomycis CSF55]
MLSSIWLGSLLYFTCINAQNSTNDGTFNILANSGVSAIHGAPLSNGKILFLGKQNAIQGKSPWFNSMKKTSAIYDMMNRTVERLEMPSATFYTSGGFFPNGDFISIGGDKDNRPDSFSLSGYDGLRRYNFCQDKSNLLCSDESWYTSSEKVQDSRWYSTVENLPDGRLFILGGSRAEAQVPSRSILSNTFEVFPVINEVDYNTRFSFLENSYPYVLYPFVHLLSNNRLFIFANQNATILDARTYTKIKSLPRLDNDIVIRNYPFMASSVLLPLYPETTYNNEVLIVGGGRRTKMVQRLESLPSMTLAKHLETASDQSARIDLDVTSPIWEIEKMPQKRLMGNAILMPDGKVLVLNGAQRGVAGYDSVASNSLLKPDLYDPKAPSGKRWKTLEAIANVKRVYGSVAFLLPDATVLIAGSDPHSSPWSWGTYPTEYRVEIYRPYYLYFNEQRPKINSIPTDVVRYGETFDIDVNGPWDSACLIRSGFVTHSVQMGQRFVGLEVIGNNTLLAPPNSKIAPPGKYMFFVLNNGAPSEAMWINIGKASLFGGSVSHLHKRLWHMIQ